MPQLSYDFLFSHKRTIFVHEAYIEPKNAQYHHYLCVNLAFTYLTDYPELFVIATNLQDILQQIQKSSDTQKTKLIEKYVSKKLIQLADFQTYSLEYSLLFTISQLNNKDFYYCITPIEILDSDSLVKKIIVENFEIQEILTSWNDEFCYEAPSQRIILKIRNKKPKITKESVNFYQRLYFTNVYNFSELEELSTFVSMIKEKDEIHEKFVKTAEQIAFHAASTHITWAVGTDFLFKNTNLTNWSKFLKMNSLYGTLLAKCRYMLTNFKNTTTLQNSFSFAHSGLYPLIPVQKNKKTTTVINADELEIEIESKYLRHVISNSNEIKLLSQKVENVGQMAFYCTKNKAELQKLKDDFACNYIEKLEEKIRNSIINNTENKIKNIDNQLVIKWYSPKQSYCDALADSKVTSYFHWAENHENYLHSATIIGLNWKKESIKYFLRSSFWHFWLENEIAIFDADGFMLMPEKLAEILVINPDLLNTEAIRVVYSNLQKREILNPIEEITHTDTQELDTLIAEALGLESDILLNLYADFHTLYSQRQIMQTVKKKHKNAKIFLKAIKNYIDNLTLGERLNERDFPEFVANFLSDYDNSIEFENYRVENSKIKVLDFLGTYEVYADKNLLFTTDSQLKIEFVKLLNLGAKNVLQIPTKEENIKLILREFKEQLNSSKNLAKNFVKEKLVNGWVVNSYL